MDLYAIGHNMEWERFIVEQVTRIDFEGELFDHYAIARKVDNPKILFGFSGYQLYRDGTVFSDVKDGSPFRQVKVGAMVWRSDHFGISITKRGPDGVNTFTEV